MVREMAMTFSIHRTIYFRAFSHHNTLALLLLLLLLLLLIGSLRFPPCPIGLPLPLRRLLRIPIRPLLLFPPGLLLHPLFYLFLLC